MNKNNDERGERVDHKDGPMHDGKDPDGLR